MATKMALYENSRIDGVPVYIRKKEDGAGENTQREIPILRIIEGPSNTTQLKI